jgi:F420-dependent hydroxymycolic acid dehydrogenase
MAFKPETPTKFANSRTSAPNSGSKVVSIVQSTDRRRVLKSAGTLLAMAAIPSGVRSTFAKENPARVPAPDTKRSIGVMLPHEQFTAPDLVRFGVAAEDAGFDFVATSDHLQPWQDNEAHAGMAWVTIGALGQKTSRLRMGTTVTCPTYRYNPAVVAEGFATLAMLYPGRIFLGVGSGEALNEQAATGNWGKWAERSERLIEATEVIRRLWKGGQVEHQGKDYNVNARLYDLPQEPIPLLMAGNGPKAMHRAGKYGDGLVTDPKTWKEHKSEFEQGVKDSGKDLAHVPVLIEQYVVVGDREEAEQAAELWRFGPKAWHPYYNIRDPRTIHERADKEIPLEKVYGEWPIGTDPGVHIDAVNKLFASGATMVNIHSGQHDQLKVIEFYGKNVIPRIRG